MLSCLPAPRYVGEGTCPPCILGSSFHWCSGPSAGGMRERQALQRLDAVVGLRHSWPALRLAPSGGPGRIRDGIGEGAVSLRVAAGWAMPRRSGVCFALGRLGPARRPGGAPCAAGRPRVRDLVTSSYATVIQRRHGWRGAGVAAERRSRCALQLASRLKRSSTEGRHVAAVECVDTGTG